MFVWAWVESSARGTAPAWEEREDDDEEEVCKGGNMEFKYSAGSNDGARKSCKKGSVRCCDFGC